jgi:amidase
MARCVEDLEAMMRLLAIAPPYGGPPVTEPRIAFYTENGIAATDANVAAVVRRAAAALSAEEDRPCCIEGAYDLEMKLLGADGGDGLRAYLADLGSAELHPLLTAWLEKLEPYRTDLAGFQCYWAEWDRYREEMKAFLRRYDAIVCPAYTHPAVKHGASVADENFRGFSHTMAYNLAGLPAAVIRCGESAGGLPIAVQVVARHWREDVALAVAARLEREFGGWRAPEGL